MTPKHAQLQIFIQGNITGGSKTKKLSRATALVSGHFMFCEVLPRNAVK